MQKEYDIKNLNPRPNHYAIKLKKQIMSNEARISKDEKEREEPNKEKFKK